MNHKPLIIVVGTRAEAIKLIPLYQALKKSFPHVVLCATYQHAQLLEDVFTIFEAKPDYNLNIMKENQDLFHITQAVLEKTKQVYSELSPQLVIVHGDTTTTMSAALAAFYLRIPIAHIEAGLRTGNMASPFPEELNRKLVGQIATYHFAPTAVSMANMLAEGAPREHIFCTGNTIVDALMLIKNKISKGEIAIDPALQESIEKLKREKKKIILLTAHRRESFDGGLVRIFETMKQFAARHDDVAVFYPMHPNPHVIRAVESSGIKNQTGIIVSQAVTYPNLIYLLMACDFVATDSGGIQEEAVSLGKRVLCLRDVTERCEGVWEGVELLVGTDPIKIMQGLESFYQEGAHTPHPSTIYGDGYACERIVSILKTKCGQEDITHRKIQAAFKDNAHHSFAVQASLSSGIQGLNV